MKQKVSLGCLLILLAGYCYSNDTYFFLSGGALIPAKEKSTAIEMKEEVIKLNLHDDFYEVRVDFTFFNPSSDAVLTVGFPFFEEGLEGKGKIWDFACWTNDIKTDFSDTDIAKEWQKPSGLHNAYIRDIAFTEKSETHTSVRYKAAYGKSAPSFLVAAYLFGTGSVWDNPIGKITLRIENNIAFRKIGDVFMGSDMSIKSRLTRISDNTYEAVFYNIEPKNYTDVFEIRLSSIIDDDGPRSFPAYFDYNKRVVDTKEFMWLRKDQLRIVRNAIYALRGYAFKSEDLKAFFAREGREWNPPYQINPNFSENDLSEIEKKNIQNLFAEEKRR